VGRKCFLESLKVLHPVECEIVRLRINLVEDNDEGKLGLVEDTANHETGQTRCRGSATTYLHAYSILDIKVAGADARGVSTMYAMTVGRADATASVIIAPEADQVNISI
jgi:hypothetical protein